MTYRERLHREGLALALLGVAGSGALLAFVDGAGDQPWSTVLQLAAVALLLSVIGPRAVRAWAAEAEETPDPGDGEPTPLWHLPLVVAAIAAPFALLGSWDAVLRVTGGSALVGVAQATVLAHAAAREEARLRGRLVRLPGSSLWRGTKLGLVPR